MPTLLQINATCNFGSTGRIAEEIAEKASANGWKCVIAHGGRYVMPSQFDTIQISSALDNKIHALTSMISGNHGLGSIVSTRLFLKKIAIIKPDIIHLHNIHGYYLNYKILFQYLSLHNIPVVWTLHDCWTMTGQCTHFVSADCELWKTGCHDCSLLKYGYKTFVDRSERNWKWKKTAFTSVKHMVIVPVSQWLEDIVSESFLNQYPIRVIHNGVDLEVFKPLSVDRSALGLDNRFTILGVSSSWGYNKGLQTFIELSHDPSIQVVLVGVQDTLLECLPKTIKAVRRTSNRQQLASYYNAADVFLNPTLADSFPTVNLESLACGTPVLTFRTGGSPETVNAETGWVVEQRDIDSVVKILNYLRLRSKAEIANQRQACRKWAEKEYDKNTCFDKYMMLYTGLLHSKS